MFVNDNTRVYDESSRVESSGFESSLQMHVTAAQYIIDVKHNRIIASFRRWNTIVLPREYPEKTYSMTVCRYDRYAIYSMLWHQCTLCFPPSKNPSEIIASRFKVYWISFLRYVINSTTPSSGTTSSTSSHKCACVYVHRAYLEHGQMKFESFRFSENFAKPFNVKRIWLHEYKSIFAGNKIYCSWHTKAKYQKIECRMLAYAILKHS